MYHNKIKSIITSLVIFLPILTWAQKRDTTLSQEVEVSKAFKPTITGADKINDMPKIEDPGVKKPNFDYSIYSQPVFNTSGVTNLKAATMAAKAKENNGYGLVKAGLGNYFRPYAELFFNNQNTKNTIFGLHGKHLSSYSSLILEGGDKVKTPYSENAAEMFIKHLFDKSVLSVNLNYNYDGFRYYGYPVDPIPPTMLGAQNSFYLNQKQYFSKGGININLINSVASAKEPKFDFDFGYHYFATKTGQKENYAQFMTDIRKPMLFGTAFFKGGVTYNQTDNVTNRTFLLNGKAAQVFAVAKPSIYLGGDMANIRIGADAWLVFETDVDIKFKIAPDVRVNFIPAKDIINIFAGVDASLNNNYYSKMAYYNPFLNPQHNIENNFEKLHVYGGFDGKIASKTNFKISVDYTMIDDQPLFYQFGYRLPTMGPMPAPLYVDNTFDVLYENLNLLKFNLELFHASTDKTDWMVSGNYYKYKLKKQAYAWNMPDWDTRVAFGYKISDRLHASANLYLFGRRKAMVAEVTGTDPRPLPWTMISSISTYKETIHNMKTSVDLNVNADYKITQRFSVFARLNNLGFQKYQRWLGYPVQNFNFMGGVSYTF